MSPTGRRRVPTTHRRWVIPVLVVAQVGCLVPAGEPPDPVIVLRGVTVIDGTGAPPVADRDVVIRGERIAAIGAAGTARVSPGGTLLELPGRHLLPGLIDTHAHVTILEFVRGDDGLVEPLYRRDLSEQALRLLLDHGITTVRNPSAPTAAGVALREDVATGAIPGPRIITSGEHIQDPRLSPDGIRETVRAQAAAGVDFIKVYSTLRPGQLHVAIEEAHRLGLPVVGHLQRTTWTEAARSGIDGITHGSPWSREYLPADRQDEYRATMAGRLDWLDWVDLAGEPVAEMIRELAARRIPLDPTLITYHTKFFGDQPRWTEHPCLALVPQLAEWWRRGPTSVTGWRDGDFARARSLWPRVEELVRRYHREGVLLSTGSDLPQPWTIPGVSLHEEMELLVAAGIPTIDVLTMATRNGAEALGLLPDLGTVEVGKVADLVILGADPLADIRNTRRIELVVRRGRPAPPTTPCP
jgi:imidazolonepropionase-like amidohydrolase